MAAGINAALLDVGGDAMAAAATHLSLHTATPNGSGSNESAAARVAAGWTSVNGLLTSSNKAFTGGAASGACVAVGLWSASTSGTFYGYFVLTGDQTFNAAGEYTVDTVTLTGTAA